MAATDGSTPLNAANVLHKISDDQHTGLLTNVGNLTVSAGYLTKASVGGVPLAMEDRLVLGGGYLILPYMFQAQPYPSAMVPVAPNNFYYPTAFYVSVPFQGVTDVIPTFTTYVSEYKNNCTLTLETAYIAYSVGKRCILLKVTVTTRTSGSVGNVPYAEGYVQVGA